MASIKSRSNPFELVKASDFSDEQIDQYWVDLTGEASLHDLFKPLLPMPMLLLGGKGSGKTHLMRYYSSSVRRIHFGNDLSLAVESDGYLGIYVRADGLNVGRFAGKGQEPSAWSAVFCYYFELWLATQFLKNVQDCVNERRPFDGESAFCREALGLFSTIDPDFTTSTLQGLSDYLTVLRKRLDRVVGNVATGRSSLSEVEVCVAPGDLVFGLADLLAEYNYLFKGLLFVYLIDEIENFTEDQQRFLNSLIRYRRGSVTFKIGCRLYGIRSKKTLEGSEEEIRQGAEYERVELDSWLRSHEKAYFDQALVLIERRLKKVGFNVQNVSQEFAEIDASDWYRRETAALVNRWDIRGDERPYFSSLRRSLERVLSEGDVDLVIESLRVPHYPLLEKANIYLFARDWAGPESAKKLADNVRDISLQFLGQGKRTVPSYWQVLDHFKSDFAAQIFRECSSNKRVPYAGLETLIHLSQGVPRNLLGLLKHIYRRAHFSGERPFDGGDPISVKSQSEGVLDAAAWFWEDSQPDKHGQEVRVAVQALAEFFASVRFSLKPAECQLSTFTVGVDVGSDAAREVLEHAENWSYLIRISTGAVDRNDSAILNEKFQLSPMLAPRWGVSEFRRGAIALNEDVFDALFNSAEVDGANTLIRKRLASMREPFRRDEVSQQGTLI